MNKQVVILRRGNAAYERAVTVHVFKAQRLVQVENIDTQAEIFKATGRSLNRALCIVDFARGVKASGYSVVIDDRRKGRLHSSKTVLEVYPTGANENDYFMFGLLWGRGQWNLLKDGFTLGVPLRDQTYTLGTLVDTGIIRM